MCGIAGIVDPQGVNQRERVRTMIDVLSHRGPDAQGFAESESCTLGHSRLAIVDLSTGAQPMHGGDTTVTFNGEIFGYQKLRAKLATSYPFQTHSDTEVILALYARDGERVAEHLPGQFAFALWDKKKRRLVCARDRFGEKPFYYAVGTHGEFIFASEIKAILASGLMTPVLDRASLAHYLKHLYVHPTKTIYKNIHTLPAAHTLVWDNGEITVTRYWNFPTSRDSLSLKDATRELETRLDQAVRDQLVADVPVGAFLSGGLDSSTIVALASRHTKHLKTFSFRFDAEHDETSFAREIAERYHTDHTELTPDAYDLGDLLIKMQEVYDEPFADSSNIPTYLLAKAAQEHVTVALTGDGGDELFGGYTHWYRPLLSMQQLAARPSPLMVAKLYLLARLHLSHHREYLGARYKQKFSSLLHAHENQDVAFTDEMLHTLLDTPLPSTPPYDPTETLDAVMREDLRNYMPGDILVKIDRASMAHGLELRAPFLDAGFAEYALALPWNLKIGDEGEKRIFREAFGELWTERVRTRRKQGFGAPIERWLLTPSITSLRKILDDPDARIFSLISFSASRRFVRANDQRTWSLLVLALWAESHDFSIA